MPAPLSIIIPTLNAASDLPECLQALMPGLELGLIREVIVSDGGSDDATPRIAGDTGATWITGASGRGAQLAAGADTARGDWLLFLHADTYLSPDWAERAAHHMERRAESAAAFTLRYRSDDRAARWLEARANRRARMFGLPYGDQGLLIHRSLYRTVGGHPDIPLMEDVALARALGRRRLKKLNAVARTGADRYVRGGWLRRGARNLLTLVRYFLGASPDALAASYRK